MTHHLYVDRYICADPIPLVGYANFVHRFRDVFFPDFADFLLFDDPVVASKSIARARISASTFLFVGSGEGRGEGCSLGLNDGRLVRRCVGERLGLRVSVLVGDLVDCFVGDLEGRCVGVGGTSA